MRKPPAFRNDPLPHFLILFCFVLWLPTTASSEETLARYEASAFHMGQKFSLALYAPSDKAAEEASKLVFDRIEELDRTLSDYRPDSELSRLCSSAKPGVPVPVSDDLFNVLQASLNASRETDGLFDVTVAPLVQLWRAARRTKRLPDATALQAALAVVGYRNVTLHETPRSVEFAQAGMRIDVGGIGVGWALDDVGSRLRKSGITRFLVDGSGDILCGDPPPGRDAWRIAVQPLTEKGEETVLLSIRNCAVTTSGDAYRFVEIDGRRYSHIVDPRTGMGLTERSSVTVIAPTAVVADSFAKGVNILGPEMGMELINARPELAGSFVVLRRGDGDASEPRTPVRVVSKRFHEFVEGADEIPSVK